VKLSIFGAYVLALVALVVDVSPPQACSCDRAANTLTVGIEPSAAYSLANLTETVAQHTSLLTEHDSLLTEHTTRLTEHEFNITKQDFLLTEHDSVLTDHDSILQSQSLVLQNITDTVHELVESQRVFTGDVTIDFNQGSLISSMWGSFFAHIEVVAGTVTVKGNSVRASDINSVLGNIKHIHGNMDMDTVSFVEGDGSFSLPNLETVGGHVRIRKNIQLKSVNFSKLRSIGSTLHIWLNKQLQSLQFSVLQSIGGQLDLDDHLQLTSADFSVLQSIGMTLRIHLNIQLTSPDFSMLQSIGSDLHVENNDQLTSPDFSVLESIGGKIRTQNNKINLCTASTVKNSLGDTTLRDVCAGPKSPKCFVTDSGQECQ
jgi:hypothetical protein